MVDSPAPTVLKVSEVAALLRMGQRQVREGIIRGDIPCRKIGGQVRCSHLAITRWLNGEGAAYRATKPLSEAAAMSGAGGIPRRRVPSLADALVQRRGQEESSEQENHRSDSTARGIGCR